MAQEGLRTRTMTIVAQDPAIQDPSKQPRDSSARARSVLLATVEVPAEKIEPGPRGHRVYVIDYDAENNHYYKPVDFTKIVDDHGELPYRKYNLGQIVADPEFHAMNVYAIVMRTLARFEFALGRRVTWAAEGHQLKVFPHGIADANAFYSPRSEALVFGYFPGANNMVFSCLSHDVIVHETTHALLDGLRDHFTDPSSPDQAAFHEGFADIVALLSVLSLPEVVAGVLDYELDHATGSSSKGDEISESSVRTSGQPTRRMIHKNALTSDALKNSILLGLANQMGSELGTARGTALRRSAALTPSRDLMTSVVYQEPHRRGEILSAAVLQAFLGVWLDRIDELKQKGDMYDRSTVAREGAEAADYLLTMTIRALDYTPPVHLRFRDYLTAVLTADSEVRTDDSKYHFRKHLKDAFNSFGIRPQREYTDSAGRWKPVTVDLEYGRTRFASMQSDPDEVFKWVWENREALGMVDAYTVIESIRPSTRVAPEDGFTVRETVVECIQRIELTAQNLKDQFGLTIPKEIPMNTVVSLVGGATLIFDDYGRLKFIVPNLLPNPRAHRLRNRTRLSEAEKQLVDSHRRSVRLYNKRIRSLIEHDNFELEHTGGDESDAKLVQRESATRFVELHLNRAVDFETHNQEAW